MEKIMLVIENKDDQDFIEKVLLRLKYPVISVGQGANLTEQLIEHFPDVVFASMLGRNTKMLMALGKIREARGKPQLVYVRQPKEPASLSLEQKSQLDGIVYSPIDPFKVIDVLCNLFDLDKIQLRRRYNEMLELERDAVRQAAKKDNKPAGTGKVSSSFSGLTGGEEKSEKDQSGFGAFSPGQEGATEPSYGKTDVFGGATSTETTKITTEDQESSNTKKSNGERNGDTGFDPGAEVDLAKIMAADVEPEGYEPDIAPVAEDDQEAPEPEPKPVQNAVPGGEKLAPGPAEVAPEAKPGLSLVNDEERRDKYAAIVANLEKTEEKPAPMDAQKLRRLQKAQAEEINEDQSAKENRKHFLKTLFTISPNEVSKK